MTIYYIEEIFEFYTLTAVEVMLFMQFREWNEEQKDYKFDYKKIWEYLYQNNDEIFQYEFDIKLAFLYFYSVNRNEEVNFTFEGDKLIELKKEDFDKADTIERSKELQDKLQKLIYW